jgi:putative transposase
MARPLRIQFPGAVYHVTARGNRQSPIFHDEVDRLALRNIFGGALERFDASALAWCLMGNHYHWVIQTRQANLSLLMRHVNGVYTQRFNRRHQKVGHVFQGRFTAILVDSQRYLLEACRYVELNPVRAGLAQDPAQWPWSSYAALTGLAPSPPWLDRAAVWGHVLGHDVGSQPQLAGQAAQAYAQLVAAGKGVRLWPTHLRQQVYLGDEHFVQRMQAQATDAALRSPDIPRTQRATPLTLQDCLATQPTRDEAILAAHRHGHLSMSHIAKGLGLSVSRVSRIVSKQAKGKT